MAQENHWMAARWKEITWGVILIYEGKSSGLGKASAKPQEGGTTGAGLIFILATTDH